MQTKEAIIADYNDLIQKVNKRLNEFEHEVEDKQTALKQNGREEFARLKRHQSDLHEKYKQIESTAENSLSHIIHSVESTYNDAMKNLSHWLNEQRTRN